MTFAKKTFASNFCDTKTSVVSELSEHSIQLFKWHHRRLHRIPRGLVGLHIRVSGVAWDFNASYLVSDMQVTILES